MAQLSFAYCLPGVDAAERSPDAFPPHFSLRIARSSDRLHRCAGGGAVIPQNVTFSIVLNSNLFSESENGEAWFHHR